jgi:DNA recombination protein RmuC
MAEDVLRLAGLVENVNYVKQKALETASTRPDYTFLLPQGLKVNMDVKFPLDNYMRCQAEEAAEMREGYKSQFLRDVRQRIKEVTTRDYINPEERTVDYVLVFIPNEQVYAFINEQDNAVIDAAMKIKVILCSPCPLYAMLAVIRQAVDSFNLENTAAEILALLGAFSKQWAAYQSQMEKMGERLEDAHREYEKLTTTRSRQLERVLNRIEDLRKQKGIEVVEGEDK